MDERITSADVEYVIRAQNIVKEFSGVRVLDNVNFNLKRGEVHALLGENGAGKSTLMKILAGVYQKTSGELYLNGELVDFKNRMQMRTESALFFKSSHKFRSFRLQRTFSLAESYGRSFLAVCLNQSTAK